MARRIRQEVFIGTGLILTAATLLISPPGYAGEEKAACAWNDVACNLGKVGKGVTDTVGDALEGKGIRKPGDPYEVEAEGPFNGQYIRCFKGDNTAYVVKQQDNTRLGGNSVIGAYKGGVSMIPIPCDKMIEGGMLQRVNRSSETTTRNGERRVYETCNGFPAGDGIHRLCVNPRTGRVEKRWNIKTHEFSDALPEDNPLEYEAAQKKAAHEAKMDKIMEETRQRLETGAKRDEERAAQYRDRSGQQVQQMEQMKQMMEMMQKMQAGQSGKAGSTTAPARVPE